VTNKNAQGSESKTQVLVDVSVVMVLSSVLLESPKPLYAGHRETYGTSVEAKGMRLARTPRAAAAAQARHAPTVLRVEQAGVVRRRRRPRVGTCVSAAALALHSPE
jgi:hypothetical protein